MWFICTMTFGGKQIFIPFHKPHSHTYTCAPNKDYMWFRIACILSDELQKNLRRRHFINVETNMGYKLSYLRLWETQEGSVAIRMWVTRQLMQLHVRRSFCRCCTCDGTHHVQHAHAQLWSVYESQTSLLITSWKGWLDSVKTSRLWRHHQQPMMYTSVHRFVARLCTICNRNTSLDIGYHFLFEVS